MILYILRIHVYFADTGIFIVSHGSHVSQICRSKVGSLRCNWYCNWYRESRNLWIWIFGNLELLASGYCPKTVLFLFCLISGLRNVLDFFSFMLPCLWESKGWIRKSLARLIFEQMRKPESLSPSIHECLSPWVLESLSAWILQSLSPGAFESWRLWILGSRYGNLGVRRNRPCCIHVHC